MTRAIIKFRNGESINIEADSAEVRIDTESWLVVWKGESIVALVRLELIDVYYLSKQKEAK